MSIYSVHLDLGQAPARTSTDEPCPALSVLTGAMGVDERTGQPYTAPHDYDCDLPGCSACVAGRCKHCYASRGA